MSHILLVIPIGLIVIIAAVDLALPRSVHLGPLLVVAPALTASFAGPRCTAAIGALALAADVVSGLGQGVLRSSEHNVEMLALFAVSAVVVVFRVVHERHLAVLHQVRSVSEIAQRVLLRPLPRRVGPLRIASIYLAAAAEARIGGDLYAAARTDGVTRLLIGDVRGKGLPAISDAAASLCAFREASHGPTTLPELMTRMETSLCQNLTEHAETDTDAQECFVTAAVAEIPDAEPKVHVIACGHPPPLLLRGNRVLTLQPDQVAPPLGLELLTESEPRPATFPFEPGDILLLYTDGVIEARDRTGTFFDLPAHLGERAGEDAGTLVERLRERLFEHVNGHLHDDTAMIAVERLATPEP
ncbi:PP2C family protein-serine/threonine phosphatase [Microbispora sp. H13382]|uniref:PP2C family protein-serine/threonine phosphatase n=1 Tax=Microbispora sp. H13382 TaxID=2729112 RepID=UPI001C7280E9|nr:PP2C family protein-serine/threonine phosphatase [Microbispora sp. H13382]